MRCPRVLFVLLAGCAPTSSSLPGASGPSGSSFQEDPGGLVAHTPGHRLHTRADAWGVHIQTGLDAISLRTRAVGRGADLTTLPATEPTLDLDGHGIDRASGDLVERWHTSPAGLEQAWSLEAPPEGDGPLTLAVAVGGATPSLDGARVVLAGAEGERLFYHGLSAWDADGVTLPAELAVQNGEIHIAVDDAGAVYPIQVDPIAATATTSWAGSASDMYYGMGLGGIGDVNGDGYDDLAIGAYGANTNLGRVDIYYGSEDGFAASADLSVAGSSSSASSSLGWSVGAAGDVNGDGYGDAIFGTLMNAAEPGQAFVHHGGPAGLSSAADTTLTGSAASAGLGYAVLGLGDVDGDGYDDVAVSSPSLSSKTGQVEIYAGSSAGISGTPVTTITGATSSMFGGSLAKGDFNADGLMDLAVGAHSTSSGKGAVYIFHGQAGGFRSGKATSVASTTLPGLATGSYFGWIVSTLDANADGYDDLAVSAYGENAVYVYDGSATGLGSTATTTLTGDAGSKFGKGLSGAGDVDGDGYGDLVVGAQGEAGNRGAVAVYQGSASGLETTASTTVPGATSSQYLGCAVAGVGDVDLDGYDDVLVSSFGSISRAGKVELYRGYRDVDQDGYTAVEDCDDLDASVHPDAEEVCDGVDNNCDLDIDGADTVDISTWRPDGDGDGYGDARGRTVQRCEAPEGYVLETDSLHDCDDADPSVSPAATEVVADGIDQDCSGVELCYVDADGDGYLPSLDTRSSADLDCDDAGEAGADALPGDCDDDDATTHPGAADLIADQIDSDCDGVETCYVDGDGDGYRVADGGTVESADADCRDAGEAGASWPEGDCDDSDASRSPGTAEILGDGVDQNCDGGDTCYADADDDGYRPSAASPIASADLDCLDPGEAVSADPIGDCDDIDPSVSPSAEEVCDGQDNDCDAQIDAVTPTEGLGAWMTTSLCDDADDDGLLDWTERTALGTDPDRRDTDQDGVDDGTERGLTSPERADATDLAHFQPDLDPATNTDPLNEDSDSDGLDDGDEDDNGDGAQDATETDPTRADSDGGGTSDGQEWSNATDPLDPADDVAEAPAVDTATADTGPVDTGEAETTPEAPKSGEPSGGCGCTSAPSPGAGLSGLGALMLILRRRGRRS